MFFLLMHSSCRPEKFPDYNEGPLEVEEEEFSFNLIFQPINPKLTGLIQSELMLWLSGNQFYIRINMKKGPRSIKVLQYLHESDHCPDLDSDFNGDEIIDFSEAQLSAGKIFIKFDGSLRSTTQGHEWYPRTDRLGKYYYSRSANMRLLLRELREKQILDSNQKVDFRNRIIMIYGSEQDPLLPLGCAEII